jgi:type I restriction enzyme S subunit
VSTSKSDKSIALSTSWDVKPLGEVVQPTRPRIKPSEKPNLPFIGMGNIEAHTMKLLGTVPAGTMKSSAVHFQPDDVLYGRLRPYLNKVYRPDFEGLCSAEFIVFPKTEGISSRYLQYFLNSFSFASHATHLNAGDRPRVDFEQLSPYPFPVAPYEQQKRIVAEIEKQFSRLDEAVANLRRVKANLKRYKASVLKTAVEGELAPTAEPWKQVVLGDVATSIRNGYSKKPDAEHGTRIFRISAVRPMKLDVNDVRYLSGTPADYEPFLVEPGDVLFTRYNGNRDYVGVCARVPGNLPPTVYPDKLIRVRVPRLMMLPEFLVILASTGRAREYIESKIRTTAGQSGISGGDLKSIPLDVPKVAEQQQIVAEVERHLSVIDELEAAVNANLTRADRLRQSVLNQVFSGGIRLVLLLSANAVIS